VTLLPPTEVVSEALEPIEEHLRTIAATEATFDITLRGSATFQPVSPVVFVPLVQGISECERLAARVRSGPLARELSFPYHPHVTVAHDLPPEALDRAFEALRDYDATFRVWGLTLFEQGVDATWRPQRDFVFGAGTSAGADGAPGPVAGPRQGDDGW
jgi:2'-5' RNA ligase